MKKISSLVLACALFLTLIGCAATAPQENGSASDSASEPLPSASESAAQSIQETPEAPEQTPEVSEQTQLTAPAKSEPEQSAPPTPSADPQPDFSVRSGYWYSYNETSCSVAVFDDNTLSFATYPGEWGRGGTFSTILPQADGSFDVIVSYPAGEWFGDWLNESKAIYNMSSQDGFTSALKIITSDGEVWNYTYGGDDWDACTALWDAHFSTILAPTPTETRIPTYDTMDIPSITKYPAYNIVLAEHLTALSLGHDDFSFAGLYAFYEDCYAQDPMSCFDLAMLEELLLYNESLAYTLMDINASGSPELLISDGMGGWLCIYTLDYNGQACYVESAGGRAHLYVLSEGRLLLEGSNSAFSSSMDLLVLETNGCAYTMDLAYYDTNGPQDDMGGRRYMSIDDYVALVDSLVADSVMDSLSWTTIKS